MAYVVCPAQDNDSNRRVGCLNIPKPQTSDLNVTQHVPMLFLAKVDISNVQFVKDQPLTAGTFHS